MLGIIIKIENNIIYLKPNIDIYQYGNIINKHVIFESNTNIVGEILNINENFIEIIAIGEIINKTFIYGNSNMPSFNCRCRLINKEDLEIIFGTNAQDYIKIGNKS